MKRVTEHTVYGQIVYNENIWIGKVDISINGVKLIKVQDKKKKNTYIYDTGEAKIEVLVLGNVYSGVKMTIGGETIEIEKKSSWYEIACSVSIFVLVLIWGNNPYLCSIVPIIGGAIGGGISGAMGILNLRAMKSIKNVAVKLAIWLAMLISTLLICFFLAIVFLIFFEAASFELV